MQKPRNPAFSEYKSKEWRGDALIKFIVSDLYIKKFPDFQTYTHIPMIDRLISNGLLIKEAKKLNLIPKFYKESLKELGKYHADKPFADAFEVHVYEIYEKEGLDATIHFIEETLFNDNNLEKVRRRLQKEKCEYVHVDGRAKLLK